MADHTTIPLTKTKTPVEFTKTLDMVDRLAVSLQGDGKGNGGLRTLIDSGASIADGGGERMKSALGELSKALKLSADGGAQTKEQLTRVVDNLSSLMDGAAERGHPARIRFHRKGSPARCWPTRIWATAPPASSSTWSGPTQRSAGEEPRHHQERGPATPAAS